SLVAPGSVRAPGVARAPARRSHSRGRVAARPHDARDLLEHDSADRVAQGDPPGDSRHRSAHGNGPVIRSRSFAPSALRMTGSLTPRRNPNPWSPVGILAVTHF